MRKQQVLQIQGKEVSVSNLDKLLFPAGKFTKADLIKFYADVSPVLLRHLKDRPVTLKRFPNGVNGEAFWEKDVPQFAPDWIRTTAVPRKLEPGFINYILINDVRSLVWCASIATIELHPFLHSADNIQQPTTVVFDLDPGEGTDTLDCAEVAFLLKEKMKRLKLKAFPKVSGSKGIQIHVPLNTAITYDATKRFARHIAEQLAREHPRSIVAEMAKTLRRGKVFIDWSQNIETKTTVGVYSVRAKHQRPFISMPVKWSELKRAVNARDAASLFFDPAQALKRLDKIGDLYAPVLKLKQHLPEEFARLAAAPVIVPRSKRLRTPVALEEYERKRNFSRTSEPGPSLPRRSQQGGKRRFVIQKHAASHLHYDLRLEVSDTLKSWAVPKGLPFKAGERRSAFAVEDHPIDYLSFEGVIPEGQYGGGTVMVWDIGTYEVLEGNYRKGYLHLFFSGAKLKGEWLLERKTEGDKPRWLVTKTGKSVRLRRGAEDKSALSGRTMADIAAAKDAVWQSNRDAVVIAKTIAAPTSGPHRAFSPLGQGRVRGGGPRRDQGRDQAQHQHYEADLRKSPSHARSSSAAPPHFIAPMLALKVHKLPSGPQWLYEWKWDGYRAIAIKHGSSVHLFSRKGRDQTSSFPAVADALKTLHANAAIIDGEIIAINQTGEVSFQHLQNRATLPAGWHILFCAFDLLNLDGTDLRKHPLEERKERLREIVRGSAVLYSSEIDGQPEALIREGKKTKREGIVAKRRDSIYQSGTRSDAWRKLQLKPQQEFVVGGFRPGGKKGLELLLVGYYQGKQVLYAGKVRSGLDAFNRKALFFRLDPLRTPKCPFVNLPNSRSDHFGESVTAEEMNDYVWVAPELVVQVEFSEWTKGSVLRHADFMGVREDKEPKEVLRE